MAAKETKLLWKEKKSIGNNTCRYVLNDHVSQFTSLSIGYVSTFLTGCRKYFNRDALLNKSVDLANEKSSNDLRVRSNRTCNLIASYFHDYDGFQSNWRHVADGFFALVKKKGAIKSFAVEVSCSALTSFLT